MFFLVGTRGVPALPPRTPYPMKHGKGCLNSANMQNYFIIYQSFAKCRPPVRIGGWQNRVGRSANMVSAYRGYLLANFTSKAPSLSIRRICKQLSLNLLVFLLEPSAGI